MPRPRAFVSLVNIWNLKFVSKPKSYKLLAQVCVNVFPPTSFSGVDVWGGHFECPTEYTPCGECSFHLLTE